MQFNDVRTRSIPTAAILILLGHEPIDVRRDNVGAPLIVFEKSAEADLLRFHETKLQVERYIRGSGK